MREDAVLLMITQALEIIFLSKEIFPYSFYNTA